MTVIELDGNGAVSLRLLPFKPLRQVRTLRGKLAELLAGPPSQDFIKAVLTDDAPQIDAMKRLRAVYPNACQLSYERHERAPELKAMTASTARLSDPIDLIGDFIQHVRGEGPTEAEIDVLTAALAALKASEDAE